MPRLYELERYWDLHPPVGDLVSAYMGYKPARKQDGQGRPSCKPEEYGGLQDLINAFAAAGGQVDNGK